MKRYLPRIVPIGLLLLCSAMVGAQTTTAPRPAAATQRITPNWNNTDIMVVAQGVGEVIGKTFIANQQVRFNVNFVGSRALSPTELYAAFLNLLQVWGYAAVDSGNGVVKIVQDAQASKMPGSGQTSTQNGGGDEMISATLETKNVSALQVSQALRPFLTSAGQLNFVPGTNTMLIIDRASTVNFMRSILSTIDKAIDDTIDAVALENSTAADIVKSVKAAMPTTQPADAANQAAQISSDDRTNSVLIRGSPAQRLSMKALIATLDKPIDNGGGTQVRYLRNTRAETIAPKLKEIATGVAVVAATGPAGAPGANANAAAAAAAAANNSVSIVADEFTNSLVITAPPKTMKSLMAAIDKLDIALAQVNISAIVADVSDTKAADIGVNWAEFSNKDGTRVPASSFISPVGSATGNPVTLVDLIKGVSDPANAEVIPGGATFVVGQLRDNGLNLGAMLRLLRADTNTNVLVDTNVTTMDNKEAKLENSQQVPLLSGSYSNPGGGNGGGGGNIGNAFNTVQRTPVGTILTVTPQINGSNEMTLTINLESSGLTGASGDSGSLITFKRQITTSVRVASGDTIVIGGLISDSKSTGENRVPWISRIPVLGELFKTRNGKREKTNLMVFIRPTIMLDGVQAGAVTDSKYNITREAQLAQSAQKDLLPVLPTDSPLLPELAPPPRSSTPAVGKP